MFKDYLKYKVSDYLTDDYFIDSMLQPTSLSEEFWKGLIDSQAINTDEFISAYMVLKSLHENKPEVSGSQIELLWNRIEKTNYSKERRIKSVRLFRYVAVACSLS